MKHYSPSSDDSPIDHRHTVRLSDFRHVAPRPAVLDAPPAASAFARAENQRGLDALSVIHGSQSSLRSSIQQERQRIHAVTEEVQANTSALFQSPHRRPPHPPVSANTNSYVPADMYEPVDYTSVHSPQTIGNARSRLSSLIHRERVLRQEIERNQNPAVMANRLPRRAAPRRTTAARAEHPRERDAPHGRGSSAEGEKFDRTPRRNRSADETAGGWGLPRGKPPSFQSRDHEQSECSSSGDDFSRHDNREQYRHVSASAHGFRRKKLDQIHKLDLDRNAEVSVNDRRHRDASSIRSESYADEAQEHSHPDGTAVPLSSLTVKNLFDNQREAIQRLKIVTAEVRKAESFQDIALAVGAMCSSPAVQAVGLQQCSVWFIDTSEAKESKKGGKHLWTQDSHGMVFTAGSSAVPRTFDDCWRRQELDAASVGQKIYVTTKDPSCIDVDEFDSFVATLGGLSFQSDEALARDWKGHKYAVSGIEGWSSICTIDWATSSDLKISDDFCIGGLISAAIKQDPSYKFLSGSETIFIEQVLMQISLLVSSRCADLKRKQKELTFDAKVEDESRRLLYAHRLVEYSELFEAAETEKIVLNLLAQCGVAIFQNSLTSFVLLDPKHSAVGAIPAHGTTLKVLSKARDRYREGVIGQAADELNSLHSLVKKSTPGRPQLFPSTLSSVSASGLLQFSDIEAFENHQDLSILSIAIGGSLPHDTLAEGNPSTCFVLVVFDSKVQHSDLTDTARHLSRWAHNAFQRICRSTETGREKNLISLLHRSLLSRTSDDSNNIIADLHSALKMSNPRDEENEDASCVDVSNDLIDLESQNLIDAVNVVSTAVVAESLGAESSFVLLAESFLGTPTESTDSLRFYGVSESIHGADARASTLEFACELVSKSRTSESSWSNLDFHRWITFFQQHKIVRVESMYSQHSPDESIAATEWSELKKLVRTVNVNTVSALLIPIFTPGKHSSFAGVLILCNKSAMGGDAESFFDDRDCQRMNSCEASSQLGHVFQTALLQDRSKKIVYKYKTELSILSRCARAYDLQLEYQRNKIALLKKFYSWKRAADVAAELDRKNFSDSLTGRYHNSVSALLSDIHSTRNVLETEVTRFVQKYAQEIFMDDHVSVDILSDATELSASTSWVVTPSKRRHGDVNRVEMSGIIKGSFVSSEIAVDDDSVGYIMSQIQRDEETVKPQTDRFSPVNFSRDELKHWERSPRLINIRVRVSRMQLVGKNSVNNEANRAFSELEESILANFCEIMGCGFQLSGSVDPTIVTAQMAAMVVDSVLRQLPARPVPSALPPMPASEQMCSPAAVNPFLKHSGQQSLMSESDKYTSSFASPESTSASSSLSSSSLSSESNKSHSTSSVSMLRPEADPFSQGSRPAIPESVILVDNDVAPPPPPPESKVLHDEIELCDTLLDCLLKVMPILFDGVGTEKKSNKFPPRDVYFSLCRWLKRLSKGDVALLHIPSRDSEKGRSADTDGFVSSEDAVANDICSGMMDTQGFLDTYIADETTTSRSGATLEDAKSSEASNNFVFRLLDGIRNGGDLGEVKVIFAAHAEKKQQGRDDDSVDILDNTTSNHRGMFNRRKMCVRIISYLLSMSLAIPSKIVEMKSLITQGEAKVSSLEEQVAGATRLLMTEKSLTEGLRGKLSAVLSLVVLIEKIGKMPTLSDLAMVISEGLPSVLGVESAVLLLPPQAIESCNVAEDESDGNFTYTAKSYGPLSGTGDDLIAVMGSKSGPEEKGLHVTWKQLRQVALFSSAANTSTVQTYIPLSIPANLNNGQVSSSDFGAILLFCPQRREGEVSGGAWAGLEDFLVGSLSTSMYSTLSGYRNESRIFEFTAGMKTMEKMAEQNKEQEELIVELRDAQEAAAQHVCEKDEQIDQLRRSIEVQASTDEVELNRLQSLLSESEGQLAGLRNSSEERILELSTKCVQLKFSLDVCEERHLKLRSMMKSFVGISSGSGTAGVGATVKDTVAWMQDIAHSHGYVLGMVQRDMKSDLTLSLLNMPRSSLRLIREDSLDYLSIKSTVVSAATEALRCGDLVECNINSMGSRHSTGAHPISPETGVSVTMKSPLNSTDANYSILCYPNKSVLNSNSPSICACIVFLRVEDSEHDIISNRDAVSAEGLDREMLLWAAGMTGHVIYSNETQGGGLESLNRETEILRSNSYRKDRLIEMLNQAFIMTSELWTRSIGTTADVAKAIEKYAALLLTPVGTNSSEKRQEKRSKIVTRIIFSSKKKPSDGAARRAFQSNTAQRVGLTVFVPISRRTGLKGDVFAVLRVERNLTSTTSEGIEESNSAAEENEQTVSSLAISEEEEIALKWLCGLSIPCFDRISLISNTYEGVEQASRAIEALQEVQEGLKEKLADEIAAKYLVKDLIKASTSTMNVVLSRGHVPGQAFETLKKGVLSVLGAQECNVISVDPSVFFGGVSASTAGPTSTAEAHTRHYTIDEDRCDVAVEIQLHKGDVELITLQTGRPIIFSIGGNGSVSVVDQHEEWGSKSWAVRRHLEKSESFTRVSSLSGDKESSERVVGVSSSRGSPNPRDSCRRSPVHVMTVPFTVVENRTAVVVVVRRLAEFSEDDKECLSHLLKLCTLCMRFSSAVSAASYSHERYDKLCHETAIEQQHSADAIRDLLACTVKTVHTANEEFDENIAVRSVANVGFLEGVPMLTSNQSTVTLCRMLFGQGANVDVKSISESEYLVYATSKAAPYILRELNVGHSDREGDTSTARSAIRLKDITCHFWVDRKNAVIVLIGQDAKSSVSDCFNITVELAEDDFSEKAPMADISATLIKIRIIFLVRLLSLQSSWVHYFRDKMAEMQLDKTVACAELEGKCNKATAMCSELEADKEKLFVEWNEQHEQDLLVLKDRYKSLIFDRSRVHKLTEMFFKTTVSACTNALDISVPAFSLSSDGAKKRKKKDTLLSNSATALLKVLIRACGNMSTGMTSRICYCKSASSLDAPPTLSGGLFSRPPNTATPIAVAADGFPVTWVDISGADIGKNSSRFTGASAISSKTQERTVVSATHPIYLCMSLNSYVLVTHGPDNPDVLDEVQRYQANANSIPVVVCRCDEYPHGTLFIPVNAPPSSLHKQRVYFTVVASPAFADGDNSRKINIKISGRKGSVKESDDKKQQFGWPISMKNLIFSWNALRETCCAVASHHESTLTDRDAFGKSRKREAIALFSIFHNAAKQSDLRNSFFRWKTNHFLDTQLSHVAENFEAHQRNAHSKISLLEQAVADWAEIVKSVNSVAVGSLSQGLKGVWAQACVPFMTLMSGHVEVLSCGLLVANHLDDILELSVKDTVDPLRPQNDGTPSRDWNSDSIEIKTASELGAGVLALTWNIISGNIEERRGKNQRIWKLNKQDTLGVFHDDEPSGGPEQMWLVPVRTAWAVLGVLRLSVRSTSARTGDSFFEDDFYHGSVSVEDMHPMEQAKRNMINFAEVLAPIVLAARQIDVATSREQEMTECVEVNSRREKAAVSEAHALLMKTRLLHQVTTDIASALDTLTLRDIEDMKEDVVVRGNENHSSGNISESYRDVSGLKANLERILSQSFGHTVVIVLNFTKNVTASGPMESQKVSDFIMRHSEAQQMSTEDKDTDNLSFQGDILSPKSCSELIKNDVGDVLGTITVLVPPVDAGARDKETEHLDDERHFEHEAVAAVLPVAAKLLYSMFLAFQRRIAVGLKIINITNSILEMERNVEESQQRVESFALKEKDALSTCSYYKTIAEISSQCLSINAAITSYIDTPSESSSDTNKDIFDGGVGVHQVSEGLGSTRKQFFNNTGLLLSRFCEKIEDLVNGRCSFRFGIISRDSTSTTLDDGKYISAEDVSITWYHSGKNGTDEHFIPTDANFGAGGLQVVNNLAAACVTSMQRSSVDVSFSAPGEMSGPEMVKMNVVSIPLSGTSSVNKKHRGLGVLQVFFPVSDKDDDEILSIGNEIASAVSATLTNITLLHEMTSQLEKLSRISIDMQDTAEQSQVALEFWKDRARQWRGIGLMCGAVVKGMSAGSPLMNTLFSDDILSYLGQAGVRMTKMATRVEQIDSAFDVVKAPGGGAEGGYESASMTVPLSSLSYGQNENDRNAANHPDVDDPVVIELSCTSTSHPTYKKNGRTRSAVDHHAEDVISLVGTMIQSVEFAIKMNNTSIRETVSKCRAAELKAERLSADIECIKKEGDSVAHREELNRLELLKKSGFDSRFSTFALIFVTAVVLPAVREIVSSLGQLVERYHTETSKLRPQLNAISGGGRAGESASHQLRQIDLRAAVALDGAYTQIAVSCDKAINNMIRHHVGSGLNEGEGDRQMNPLLLKQLIESTSTKVAVPVYFHASVVVRRERKPRQDKEEAHVLEELSPKYAVYDGAASSHSLVSEKDISRAFSKESGIQRQYRSIMEKCFLTGEVQAMDMPIQDVSLGTNFSFIDLLGIDVSTITRLLSSAGFTSSANIRMAARLRICCIPLGVTGRSAPGSASEREPYRAPAVVRCVWVEVWNADQSSDGTGSDDINLTTKQLLPGMLELLCSNSAGILRWLSELAAIEDKLYTTELCLKNATERSEKLDDDLTRCRRLYRVVARESALLFDPPLSSGGLSAMMALQTGKHQDPSRVHSSKFTHPAYLAPIAATQDVCLKFLSIVRSLVRSEGQAVLLADIDTVPMSFQVISTGDALSWPGVTPGVFGKAFPLATGVSLAETATKSHKAVVVSDVLKDPRHLPQLDGACPPGTPGLYIPLRGRGGVVIGTVVAVRGEGGADFTIEDIAALDLAATLSSLSLYWCRGLGSVHTQLDKSLNRMIKLESAVQSLRGEDNLNKSSNK